MWDIGLGCLYLRGAWICISPTQFVWVGSELGRLIRTRWNDRCKTQNKERQRPKTDTNGNRSIDTDTDTDSDTAAKLRCRCRVAKTFIGRKVSLLLIRFRIQIQISPLFRRFPRFFASFVSGLYPTYFWSSLLFFCWPGLPCLKACRPFLCKSNPLLISLSSAIRATSQKYDTKAEWTRN